MKYDKNNIFAKILRGEIPCDKVYENDYVLSFHDINPQKKIHILVIPKGEYIDLDHFNLEASEKEIVEFNKSITHIVKMLKTSNTEKGYRMLTNIGQNGGQEVPHLHHHIFGGEEIGKMVI
jgi:histidine triad (HIT) family protein|tara:strand:- start:276 stop:638 length:363 start_codon:yes stop_codon:yes gene_type:complete